MFHSSREFNIIEQNLFAYQETSQIHLNLSSIKRAKEIKSDGHLSAIRVKFFAKREYVLWQNKTESIIKALIGKVRWKT